MDISYLVELAHAYKTRDTNGKYSEKVNFYINAETENKNILSYWNSKLKELPASKAMKIIFGKKAISNVSYHYDDMIYFIVSKEDFVSIGNHHYTGNNAYAFLVNETEINDLDGKVAIVLDSIDDEASKKTMIHERWHMYIHDYYNWNGYDPIKKLFKTFNNQTIDKDSLYELWNVHKDLIKEELICDVMADFSYDSINGNVLSCIQRFIEATKMRISNDFKFNYYDEIDRMTWNLISTTDFAYNMHDIIPKELYVITMINTPFDDLSETFVEMFKKEIKNK